MRVIGRDGDYTSGAVGMSPVATVGEKGDILPSRCIGDELTLCHITMLSLSSGNRNQTASEQHPHCLPLRPVSYDVWQRWPARHDDLHNLPQTYETERNTRNTKTMPTSRHPDYQLCTKKNSDDDILGDGTYQMCGKYRARILIACRHPTLNWKLFPSCKIIVIVNRIMVYYCNADASYVRISSDKL